MWTFLRITKAKFLRCLTGFNKYYPPDYDPDKHSSLNAYRGMFKPPLEDIPLLTFRLGRQTCSRRQSTENWRWHPNCPLRATVQHMVVSEPLLLRVAPRPSRYVVGHVTTTLVWASAITRRRRRLATTIRPRSTRFGANVTCVAAGSRSRLIPRCVSCSPSTPCGLTLGQNTRYVVVSGARQKDEDWDPEENGGFAVHGTPTVCSVYMLR